MATLHDNPAMECGDHKGECGCVLKMYSAMISGDQEGMNVCVCVLKMYPAMESGDHKGVCVCVCVC